jgi:hypothetical protein
VDQNEGGIIPKFRKENKIMSEFCLEFNMDNAAFDGDASIEVCRIFNSVKNQIANGCGDGIVNDVNGNTIGRWYADIKEDKHGSTD